MGCTWIMVANSSVARFFEIEKDGKLKEINTLIHPGSRLHGRDLTSDRPGRGFESSNPSRHAMESSTSPKEVEFEAFAHFISDHLDSAHTEKQFDRLYIAAGPHFLGLLRQAFKPNTTKAIQFTIDKDMTQMTAAEIHTHLTKEAIPH